MREIEGIENVMAKLTPHMEAIQRDFEDENERFKALMDQNHDLIGRVLKCHLVIEHYVERFLSAHYEIQDVSAIKLSFFQKAQLLPDEGAAAAFVKPGIIRLNWIRNQFGHTLNPYLRFESLGSINDVLHVARAEVEFCDPIEAVEAFATVACTFLIVPRKDLQEIFREAFSEVRVHAL